MRLLQLNIRHGQSTNFRHHYESIVIPNLKRLPGCKFIALMESSSMNSAFVSLTLWDSRGAAEDYEKSAVDRELASGIQNYLDELFEFMHHLFYSGR